MRFVSDRNTEAFLEKEGFNVVPRAFCSSANGVARAIRKVGVPFVVKASGKKFVSKSKLGGIVKNVKTYSNALGKFKELKKIRGAEGVLFQPEVEGKEFALGIMKTPEFGSAIFFGDIDKSKKDVSFRIVPISKVDARAMIKETQVSRGLLKPDGLAIEETLLQLSELAEKYPKIQSLNVDPLVVKDGTAVIVDARMVWE